MNGDGTYNGNSEHSWGALSPEQCLALHPFVDGRRVRDLGCGKMMLSCVLLSLGARHVTAIDSNPFTVPAPFKKRITFINEIFRECSRSSVLAFVSWPSNYNNGIEIQLSSSKVVVYLGKNHGGTGCGGYNFWRAVVQRKILVHLPERKNTLIIYGGSTRGEPRRLVPEELAGLNSNRTYEFEELCGSKRLKVPKALRDKLPGGILHGVSLSGDI